MSEIGWEEARKAWLKMSRAERARFTAAICVAVVVSLLAGVGLVGLLGMLG